MFRGDFLKTIAATGGAFVVLGRGSLAASPQGWRQFEITYRLTLQSQKVPARVWVPVPQDALDYQRVADLTWHSSVAASGLWERSSRAPIVSAAWPDPSIPREIEITIRVATRDRSGYYPMRQRRGWPSICARPPAHRPMASCCPCLRVRTLGGHRNSRGAQC